MAISGHVTGKTTLSVHPQYFVDERGSLHTKKGRKTFWGGVCSMAPGTILLVPVNAAARWLMTDRMPWTVR